MSYACLAGCLSEAAVPFTPLSLSPSGWYSTRSASNYSTAFAALAITGSGTIGSHTITTSANSNNLPTSNFGVKLRIGGTDVYTVTGISGTTVTVAETLTSTYGAGSAIAVQVISQLNDLSGNANHAANTASTGPVLLTNSVNSIAGGYTTRLATTRWLQLTNPIVFTGAYTLFFVCDYLNPGLAIQTLAGSNDNTKGTQFGINNTGPFVATCFHDNGTISGATSFSSAGTPCIIMFQNDGVNTWFSINNGALQAGNSSGSGNATIGALFHKDSTNNAMWNGWIDEAILYNSATSVANTTAVFNYLNTAFGGLY